MQSQNPYQAPQHQQRQGGIPPTHGQAVARPGTCPQCGSASYTKVNWTIWGGFLGPRMLSHVRCNACSTTFNSKTGKSNLSWIIGYNLIFAGIILFVLCAGISVLVVAALVNS